MPSSQLFIDGHRESGMDVRTQNVTAATAIANILKSSFGPQGLDKMLVDDIGDVTITNDGATILKLLEVEHPAAKVLVELADLQDQEVGDGTTSVVIIAAEFLKRANELIKTKNHPTSVISGFRLAAREAVRYVQEELAQSVEKLGAQTLINAAKTSVTSKIIGGEEAEFFSKIAVDALLRVKTVDSNGKVKYPVNAVNLLKSAGKSTKESMFIDGYALNCTIASQAMKTRVTDAKIAFLDFGLTKTKLSMGVKIIVDDPSKLEAIKEREGDIIKEKIQMILASGANVILTTQGIDDLCLKYFVEAGAVAVRRCKKEDLKRISKATGGTLLLTLANLEGGESFDTTALGFAKEMTQERVAEDELIVFRGLKFERASSIILRGPNSLMLDEMERSLHDALCIVKRTLESGSVVAGGGAVEAALSIYLETFAKTLGSREQLAIAEFAEALLVVPKTLAANAAQDATELVAILRAHHNSAQKDDNSRHFKNYGLDLLNGKVIDNLEAGVIEPTMSKVKMLKFATEAAITILRIDDVIKLNPKADPRGPEDEDMY